MPNRILRDWTDSEPVNALDPWAERTFTRLIMKADDDGRLRRETKVLRPLLYPLLLDSVREADLSRQLQDLEQAGLVRFYDVGGKQYLYIVNFRQRVREGGTKHPPPPDDGQVTVNGPPADRQPLAYANALSLSNSLARKAPANREGEKRAGDSPTGGGGLAAADLGSELKKLGISSAKVKALLPDLSARGVFPIHVHLLAEELRGKKNIEDVAAVAVSRLENGFQPRQYLSIPEVAMLAKARPLISICGTPVNGAPLKVNNGSHRPGVFWDGPNGEKFEARPDDLRADAIVLARTGDDGGKTLHDGRI